MNTSLTLYPNMTVICKHTTIFLNFSFPFPSCVGTCCVGIHIIIFMNIYAESTIFKSLSGSVNFHRQLNIYICSSNTNLVLFVLYCQPFCRCLMVLLFSLNEWYGSCQPVVSVKCSR